VDLHGLTLPQSKVLVEGVIDHLSTLTVTQGLDIGTLYIITGKGLHSAGGVSKLKQGIKGHLSRSSAVYAEVADGFKVKI